MGMEAGSVLRSPAASLPVGSALERPERRPRPLTWRVRDRVSPRGRGAFSLCPARGAVVAGVPSGREALFPALCLRPQVAQQVKP